MATEQYGYADAVTSREGRVSRNSNMLDYLDISDVTSREGRVSRNTIPRGNTGAQGGHVPRGACE